MVVIVACVVVALELDGYLWFAICLALMLVAGLFALWFLFVGVDLGGCFCLVF